MVINFDTTKLPTGTVGWTKLLEAVENAHPNDESEWIEFKAQLDPTSIDGRFTVAKAIVAFANRDPLTAAKWFGGHAVIIIGLEPGDLYGAPEVDPANLYDQIGKLLAAPAPGWDPTPIIYKGQHVLAITVDPPRAGDPIACIGKNSGKAENGAIYVRKQGASPPATSADIRRLSARFANADRTIDGLTVQPAAGDAVHVIEYPEDWLEDWLLAEEDRLLAPLAPPPPTRPLTGKEAAAMGATVSAAAKYLAKAELAAAMATPGWSRTQRKETRSEDEYRTEVSEYLSTCRRELAGALNELHRTFTTDVTFTATNQTTQNYTQTLVELRIEGNVFGYDDTGAFTDLRDYLPEAPRVWGPWTSDPLASAYGRTLPFNLPNLAQVVSSGPSPTITNGGAVTVTCVPAHLYPDSSAELITLRLVGIAPLEGPVTVTWTATAANVNGKLTGSFTIPVSTREVKDVTRLLEYNAPE